MSSSFDEALTPTLASHLASTALSHVRREFPHKLDHVLNVPEAARTPRELHPIFYVSFDWHSCVHSYWLLATLHRLFPQLPEAAAIRELFNHALNPDKVAAECAYLTRPLASSFERPYGWAWLLALQAELFRDVGHTWSATLQPLADGFVQRFRHWLPRASYPVRAGTHGNTAFALRLALEYATAATAASFIWTASISAVPGRGGKSPRCWIRPIPCKASPRLLPDSIFRRLCRRFRATIWASTGWRLTRCSRSPLAGAQKSANIASKLRQETDMPRASRFVIALFASAAVGISFGATAQTRYPQPAELPNPYRLVEGWPTIPASINGGRWGEVIRVHVARDGNVWVFHRCFNTVPPGHATCIGRCEANPPIVEFDF